MHLTPLEPWIARKAGLERLTRAELEAYQLARLQETLRLVRERSPFYRQHLAGCPTTLGSLADLSALPFTTADDIRQNPLRFLCVSQSEVERVVTLPTSGTTGTPKRIFFSRADQELTLDFFHIGMSTFTRPGDRVLILLPVARRGSVGDLLADALERMGAHGIRHGPVQDVAETLTTLFDEGANVVVGVPTQVLALVRAPAARRFPTAPIESVLLSMDHVPASIVSALEQAWPCTVYNHYGMTEMGLGGGVDCEARRGYHLREADLYVEIVDPQTGEPVPDGQPGEVVFTTLTRHAMPLLRYRTGDISRFLPGACPCGTCLKTLAHVRSRVRGIIPLGAGTSISIAELDEVIFCFDKVLDFTATLSRADGGPRLSVHLHLAAPPEEALIDPVRVALVEEVRAVRSGALAVSVTGEQSTGGAPPGHAKRRIGVEP
ncbi:MAG TPA: AMP-binding protein [Aggregatilineales bacterium]|nr:AMP-binding protein [Aggregatilineales bacterium]